MKNAKNIVDNGLRLGGERLYPRRLTSEQEKKLAGLADFSKVISASNDENPLHHLSAAQIRTREETVRTTAHDFYTRAGRNRDSDDVFLALATAVMVPNRLLEEFAASDEIPLAGALWILDYADKRDLMRKLTPLLPETVNEDLDYDVQMFEDMLYERELVLRLFQVIKGRKSKCREAFRSILGLIRKNDAENLRAVFKTTLFDYFARYCEVRARVESTDYAKWVERASSGEETLAAEGTETHIVRAHTGVPLENVSLGKRPVDTLFLLNTAALYSASDEMKQTILHNKRATEILSGFHIQDPYEIIAAFLLLENEGDFLCRMGMLTANVLTCAGFLLPWTREFNYSIDVNQFEYGLSQYKLLYPFKTSGKEFRCLREGTMVTEEQLFFLSTGYILPRGRIASRDLTEWYETQGVPLERARELAYAAMILSCYDEREHRNDRMPWEEQEAEAVETEGESEEQQTESVDQLQNRIVELNRQLKSMRMALHEAETQSKSAQDNLNESEKRTEKDRMELTNLRESLFSLMSGNEGEHSPETEDDIVFPYTLTLRTLAFGGVDAWRNGMQSLVRGARFYDRDTLRNPNMLKQADVVWLQTNAMPHSLFYHILDIARRENLTVRYFSSSSARNCAEQMVREEMLLLRDRE